MASEIVTHVFLFLLGRGCTRAVRRILAALHVVTWSRRALVTSATLVEDVLLTVSSMRLAVRYRIAE